MRHHLLPASGDYSRLQTIRAHTLYHTQCRKIQQLIQRGFGVFSFASSPQLNSHVPTLLPVGTRPGYEGPFTLDQINHTTPTRKTFPSSPPPTTHHCLNYVQYRQRIQVSGSLPDEVADASSQTQDIPKVYSRLSYEQRRN